MTHNVHVWGDSHWRVMFDKVNHGPPGYTTELMGIKTIDMCANELSGATMYSLVREDSKNGARRRILGDLDRLGPVENVGLVFGEVDCRYHNHHYFREDGSLKGHKVLELVARYKQFIEEDLLTAGRVTGHVFVYWGFAHPNGENTLLQPGQPMGLASWTRASTLIRSISNVLEVLMIHSLGRVTVIDPYDGYVPPSAVSNDGVHLNPEAVCHRIFDDMAKVLNPVAKQGLSW
jgi:hypothetical protein